MALRAGHTWEHAMNRRLAAFATLLAALLAAAIVRAEQTQAAEPKVLRVALIAAPGEYDPMKSLTALQSYLEKNYAIRCTRLFGTSKSDLPGLEKLDECDVAILFTRRLELKGEQLERLKKYCLAGRPLVGLRTASHAVQTWLDLDRVVFGGNYKNHYPAGPETDVKLVEAAQGHPILKGVTPFRSKGSLYRNTGLNKDVEVLLTGTIPEHTEPIAWARRYKGGRVFYTSLGHQADFGEESFRRLVANALYWTTGRMPQPRSAGK